MRYAIIENGKVVNVAEADEPLGPNWVETTNAGPGWGYDETTGEFIAPSDPIDTRPVIVVTGVTTDDPNNLIQPGDVTCVAGSQVTVNVELRSPADDTVLPVDAVFRMPLTARDGRERYLLASFTQGVAAIGTTIDESGCWVIDEETINRDLPEEQHMKFDGLRIFTML